MSRSLDDILHQLGGERPVAEFIGCGQPAISNWKSRGVPRGRWIDLIDMAQSLGVPLSIDEIRVASEKVADAPAAPSQDAAA